MPITIIIFIINCPISYMPQIVINNTPTFIVFNYLFLQVKYHHGVIVILYKLNIQIRVQLITL